MFLASHGYGQGGAFASHTYGVFNNYATFSILFKTHGELDITRMAILSLSGILRSSRGGGQNLGRSFPGKTRTIQ